MEAGLYSAVMIPVIAFSLLLATQEPPHVVATVAGKSITIDQVETSAIGALRQLDQQRHEILDNALSKLIEDQVLELEAKEKHTTREELVAKAKSASVTDAEIDAFYEENKSHIPKPLEEMRPQIRKYLEEKRGQGGMEAYLASLLQKYKVVYALPPYRVPLEATNAPTIGSAKAPVTIVQFVDYEGPLAALMKPRLEEVRKKYGDKVRIVMRQFPLPQHVKAGFAANAVLCAAELGNFWDMSDAILANQSAMSVNDLKETAARIGLNKDAFNKCLDSGKHAKQIRADMLAAANAGLTNPAVFVNGRPIARPAQFDDLYAIIDDELARAAH